MRISPSKQHLACSVFRLLLSFGLPLTASAEMFTFEPKVAEATKDVGKNGKPQGGGLPDAGDEYTWTLKGIK